jgi:hypothetical protein
MRLPQLQLTVLTYQREAPVSEDIHVNHGEGKLEFPYNERIYKTSTSLRFQPSFSSQHLSGGGGLRHCGSKATSVYLTISRTLPSLNPSLLPPTVGDTVAGQPRACLLWLAGR